MEKPVPVRPGELRIVIKPSDAPDSDLQPIPARIFKRTFSAVLSAVQQALKAHATLRGRTKGGEVYVSHLRMGSNEFGVMADPASVSLFQESAADVYRSEYGRVVEDPSLATAVIKLAKIADPKFAILAQFQSEEIPIDTFFARQAERLGGVLSAPEPFLHSPYFVGSAIGSFDGRLGSIDYRGAAWKGNLLLHGTTIQLECVFDRSKGEDAINPYGNKRVSVTGRAIYTGDSQLPERVEVVEIVEVPAAASAVDIRGSLTGKHYLDWEPDVENFQ